MDSPKNCVKIRVKKPRLRAMLCPSWGGRGLRRVSRLNALLTNCTNIQVHSVRKILLHFQSRNQSKKVLCLSGALTLLMTSPK